MMSLSETSDFISKLPVLKLPIVPTSVPSSLKRTSPPPASRVISVAESNLM